MSSAAVPKYFWQYYIIDSYNWICRFKRIKFTRAASPHNSVRKAPHNNRHPYIHIVRSVAPVLCLSPSPQGLHGPSLSTHPPRHRSIRTSTVLPRLVNSPGQWVESANLSHITLAEALSFAFGAPLEDKTSHLLLSHQGCNSWQKSLCGWSRLHASVADPNQDRRIFHRSAETI
jgi:hypothetical protein